MKFSENMSAAKCEHRSSYAGACGIMNISNAATIDVTNLGYQAVNETLRRQTDSCTLTGCCGQRFIAAGMSAGAVTIHGIPGNALGAYLNGASITVCANAQDAVGDTMNEGEIIVHGNIGDAAGYAMRGGRIFVKGNAGYRAGIHMKAYEKKIPVMVIGGAAGSFLGEYQAGGVIVVLGLNTDGKPIVGNFPCTGMHGGKLYLRGDCRQLRFPQQVTAKLTEAADMEEIAGHIADYGALFGMDAGQLLSAPFTVVTPDSKNPYKQMYVAN